MKDMGERFSLCIPKWSRGDDRLKLLRKEVSQSYRWAHNTLPPPPQGGDELGEHLHNLFMLLVHP